MRIAVGCLFSLVCQSQIFGDETIEKVRHSPAMHSYQKNLIQPNDEIVIANDPVAVNIASNHESSREQKVAQCPIKLNSRLQVGGNYARVRIHPHGHTSFDGNLGGAQGLYEYRPINFFYGGAKLTWREGKTEGPVGSRSLIYIDAQERLGYTFSAKNDDDRLTFYTGLGYRYYWQKLDPKVGSNMEFKYNEFYVPIGMIGEHVFNSWFSIGLGFTWMPQIYPTVTIKPLGGARWIISNEQANFYVEMPFTFTLTDNKRCSLIVNPFYEHWEDGHTTAKTARGVPLDLPGNTYNFGGVEVNFAYSF